MKQMKWIVAVPLMMNAGAAFADAYPVEWFIRDRFPQATDCRFVKAFGNRHACGEKRSELWACSLDQKDGAKVELLVNGTIGSDVGNSCSPTFVPEVVLKAK